MPPIPTRRKGAKKRKASSLFSERLRNTQVQSTLNQVKIDGSYSLPPAMPTKAAPVLLVLLLCLYEILSKNASSYFATGFSPKADAKVRTSKLPAKCFRNFFQRKPKVFTFLDINQAAGCRRLMNRGKKCLNVSLYESKIELISDSESENFVLLCRPRLILI